MSTVTPPIFSISNNVPSTSIKSGWLLDSNANKLYAYSHSSLVRFNEDKMVNDVIIDMMNTINTLNTSMTTLINKEITDAVSDVNNVLQTLKTSLETTMSNKDDTLKTTLEGTMDTKDNALKIALEKSMIDKNNALSLSFSNILTTLETELKSTMDTKDDTLKATLEKKITDSISGIEIPEVDMSSKLDKVNPTGTGSFSLNRLKDSKAGVPSIAFGTNCTASGYTSYAEGYFTIAEGSNSHTEGERTNTKGKSSHSEGNLTIAWGDYTHAEGGPEGDKVWSPETGLNLKGPIAFGGCSHAEGCATFAQGTSAHSEGFKTWAGGNCSHAEGGVELAKDSLEVESGTYIQGSSAFGNFSHAEGYRTYAKGNASHAEGYQTKAFKNYSHSEGYLTKAMGECSHTEGNQTSTSGKFSHAEGYFTEARSDYSHASGYGTTTFNYCLTAIGRYNKIGLSATNINYKIGTLFVIGNGGHAKDLSNALRVEYDGTVYSNGIYNASGADYAEYIYEWYDMNPDNEDRVGYFVTVMNQKLYKATSNSFITGITSGNPSIIGNSDEEYAHRYERDEFNRVIWEDVPDIDTGKILRNAKMKESATYDSSLQLNYIERKDRKEWDCVGMLGVIPVRDDGTCKVNELCKSNDDGIATYTNVRGFDTFLVLERINDHVIKVLFK